MRILCTGDLHMGRRPSRLPNRVDSSQLSPAAFWADIVDLACARRVDLVALTGDVIDRENRYFEAFGPLESGVRTLVAEGIQVAAVCGNHDFDVLPRLARNLDSERFRLLGSGGRWERMTVAPDGINRLHIDGWSIPSEHFRDDPLAGYDLPPDGDAPVIGLLHADLDNPGSPYAPVTTAALRRRPLSLWLLGHVHTPSLYEGTDQAGILYPGSPQALGPRESGIHGPWIVEVPVTGPITCEQVALSRTRYEAFDIDVDGAETADEAERQLIEGVRECLFSGVEEGGGALRYLFCRLRLVGRTPAHRSLGPHLRGAAKGLELHAGSAVALIDRLDVETRPDRDLREISRGSGPPAALARVLLSLDENAGEEQDQLLPAAHRKVEEIRGEPYYLDLPPPSRPVDTRASDPGEIPEPHLAADDHRLIRQWLEQQGLILLDELLAQKEASS